MTISIRSALARLSSNSSNTLQQCSSLTLPHNLPTTVPVPPLTPSPSSNSVGGLQSGQEFALVVQVSNEEGVSPPVVLSAFTLKDNAQTVIGMPTGHGVRPISGVGSVGGGDGISPGGGVGGPEAGVGVGSVDAEEDEGPGGNNRLLELVPPMIIVLVASLTTILVMALLVILLLKRRGRLRRLEQEMEQVKLNKKMVPVHSRGEDSPSSRYTPGKPAALLLLLPFLMKEIQPSLGCIVLVLEISNTCRFVQVAGSMWLCASACVQGTLFKWLCPSDCFQVIVSSCCAQVAASKWLCPRGCVQVDVSKKLRPSGCVQVTVFKWLRPSDYVHVAVSK
ncbi:uncharacterized protein [Procambarus clarkii]|uniref:uncharacterized protein n=1 Tax=Procambarus clarkii TaxID=6728 RepID=UPI0037420E1E